MNFLRSLDKPYSTIPNGFKLMVKNTQEAKQLIFLHPQVFCDFEIVKGKMDDVFLTVCGKELK